MQARQGSCHYLPLQKTDFKTIFSIKANRVEHAGTLEAHGVLLALKRLLRNPRHHSHRGLMLVDAQAVMYALRKGRSSAPTLRRNLRKIAAMELIGDVRLKFGYIPTDSNPADRPSRGLSRPFYRARRKPSKVETRLPQKLKRHLRTCNLLFGEEPLSDSSMHPCGASTVSCAGY
jgi:hypothetical protein